MHIETKSLPAPRHAWFLLALVLALSAWALWGTWTQGWWTQKIWPSPVVEWDFWLTAGAITLAAMVLLATGTPALILTALPLVMFSGMAGIGPVAAVVWYWVCATLIGAWAMAALRDSALTLWNVRNSAAGFVITGSLIGVLAHFPVCTPTLFLALISIPALLAAWRLGLFREPAASSWRRALYWRRRSVQEVLLWTPLLVGLTLVIFVTMLPELGHDALSLHLNIPAQMLATGSWNFDVAQYIWAVMPFGANWLLVPPYFLAGEAAAKLMDTSFVLATAWLAYRILVPRIGSRLALAAPALLLTMPLVFLVSASVFVEPVIGFLFLLCLAELTGSADKRQGSWIFLGAVAGYVCSAKLLGAPLLPIMLLAVCLQCRRGQFQRPGIGLIVAAVAVFGVICVQPYLVAYLKTGNPLFPFYNDIFKSPAFSTGSVFNNGQSFANPFYTHALGLGTFWDASIKSQRFGEFVADGALGLTFLVLLPMAAVAALIGRRWWVLAGLAAALCYTALVFHTQAYLRYIYQVLPWFIVFAVWGLSRLALPGLTATLLVLMLCVVNIVRYPTVYWPLGQFSYRLFYDSNFHQAMLERNKPFVVVGDIIRKMDSLRDKKILMVGSDPVYSHFPPGTIAFSWHSWPFYSSPDRDTNFKKAVRDADVEAIVHTVGRGESHESDIISMTDEVFSAFGVRVAIMKNLDQAYQVERVKGSQLSTHDPAWLLSGATPVAQGVEVSVSRVATQLIDVGGQRKALLEMNVNCPEGQLFRSQINWLDSSSKFAMADIEVHACHGDGTIINRFINVPQGITQGVLFGSSHDEGAVVIRKISVRTRR